MAKCMMIGCDLHDKSMLLKGAVDRSTRSSRAYTKRPDEGRFGRDHDPTAGRCPLPEPRTNL